MAPRRDPADMMVRHMESQTSMKLKGPEASAPTPLDRGALGPEGGEIMADAAALLHGEGGFLQPLEDPVHGIVGWRP